MNRTPMQKLRSPRGATVSLALMLVLVCATVIGLVSMTDVALGQTKRTKAVRQAVVTTPVGFTTTAVRQAMEVAASSDDPNASDLAIPLVELVSDTGAQDDSADSTFADVLDAPAVSVSTGEDSASGEDASAAGQTAETTEPAEPATTEQPGETTEPPADATSAAEPATTDEPASDQPEDAQSQATDDPAQDAADASIEPTDAEPEPESQPLVGTLEQTVATTDGASLTVRVTLTEEAGVPEGTELQVQAIPGALEDALRNTFEPRKGDVIAWGSLVSVQLVADGEVVQPAVPVAVEFATNAVHASESDGLEAALLAGGGVRRLAVTNLTGTEPGEQGAHADALVSRIGVEAAELGELALAEVVSPQFSWNLRGGEVTVYGPRRASVRPLVATTDEELLQGVSVVELFSTSVDPARSFGTRLWISCDEPAPADDPAIKSGLLACTVEYGSVPQILFDLEGTGDPVAFEAGTFVALLWDSGYREETLNLGNGEAQAQLEGLLPKGTTVQAADVTATTDAEAVTEASDVYDYATVAAWDLSFSVGGTTWAPDDDHALAMSVDAAATADGELEVRHVAADGTQRDVEATAEGGQVSFAAEDDGTYIVVERTVLHRELTASDGQTYDITVSYDGTAGLPRQTDLRVSELAGPDLATYEDGALAALGGDSVAYLRAFDITLVGPDGAEVEPTGAIDVQIRLADGEAPEQAQVLHFADPTTTQVLDATATAQNGAVSYAFGTDSFSVYAVVEVVRQTTVTASNGKTYKVTVTYDSRSGIPETAGLRVAEVPAGDEHDDYVQRAADALGREQESFAFAHALDISLVDPSTGERHQPTGDVRVRVELLEEDVQEGDGVSVVHFPRPLADDLFGVFSPQPEPEVLDSAVDDGAIEFESGGFSVYVVVQIVKEQILTASDGQDYKVTVTYDSNAGIPEDAKLSVTELTEGSDAYDAYVEKTAETLGKEVKHLAFAHAFDISLVNPETGEHYQPNQIIKVRIELLSEDVMPEDNVSVVHFPGTYMENPMPASNSAGNINAESVEVIENAVVNGAVEFEASSFSIYIVTKDTITRTYTFMNGSAVYSVQTLKDGQSLAEPPAPTKDGAVFQHWSATEGGEAFTGFGPVTVSETDQSQVQNVTLYAVYGDDTIYVTYYAQDGEVYRRDSYVRPTGSNTLSVDTTAVDYSAGQKDEGTFMKFRHWTEGQLNLAQTNPPQAGSNGVITLTKDSNNYDLYPVISEGHWIYFDVNKTALGDENANVSYVAPVFVVNGDSSAQSFTAGIPTTAGYTFDGWYTRRSGGTQIFDSSGVKQTGYQDLLDQNNDLANNPTLYAHWTMSTSADYMIIIWKQKVTDRAGIADDAKKYDYEESTTLSGTPGNTVSVRAADINKIYDGFTYNASKSETSKTLAADGSTVLNVYYDRKTITINFYTYYTVIPNGTYSNNTRINVYTANSNGTYTQRRLYYYNGAWYTSINGGGTKYAYAYQTPSNNRWNLYETFTGLDHQTFEQAGYTWPTEYWWRDNGNADGSVGGSRTTFLAGFILTTGGTTANYYGGGIVSADTTIEFHQQGLNADGSAASTYALINSVDSTTGTFSISDKYAGFKAVRFTNAEKPGGVALPDEPNVVVNGNNYYATGISNEDLKIYFNRVTESITFARNDGTNDIVEVKSQVPFDSPLNKWFPTSNPTREGYTFTGWYYDEVQKAPVEDDDTMPASNLLLYAGWDKIRYEVNIEANGGVIGQPNNTNAVYFKNYYDEKVNEYSDVVRNYVNVGPWTEGDTRTHYAYHEYRRDGHYVNGTKVDNTTEDPNVTEQSANWKRTAKYVEDNTETGIYVYEEGAYTLQGWYEVDGGVMSTTPFNFNALLQHDTTLRAKWRRTSHFTVVYEANTGGVTGMRSPFDQNRYIEGANAIVEASIGVPEGKRFVGWKDKNGTVYAPNALLAISEDKAVELADRSLQITLTAEYADATIPDGYMADYVFMIADGDDGNNDGVDTQHYKQTIAAGETLVSPVNPTKDGMLFDGWFFDREGKHRFDGFGKIDNPVYTTLYAHFTSVHVVTYYTPDDSGTQRGATIITAQNYRPGEFLNTLYVICPTDDEHMVDHWTDGTNNYPYNSSTNTPVNADLTLWAVLAEQKFIRFDLQGGKTADGASSMEPIRIPSQGWPALPTEPVRPGYTFEGWFTEPNGAGHEYLFNKSVDDFKTENGLTGELILYAKWATDTAHPVQAKLTVLWYAQLSAGPDGGYDDENYELAGTGSLMMNVGSYNLSSAATKAVLDAGFGDIYHTDRLKMLYEGTEPRYAQAKLPNYFEHSSHHDLTFTVEDSGESILKIYFDRKVYYYQFNLDKDAWNANISTYGNEIHKGNTATVYTASEYTLPIWLEKYVYNEWPIEEDVRKTTGDKYWVFFDKNNKTNSNFYGWKNTTTDKNYYTALYAIPSARIDEFVDNRKQTIELTVYTTSNSRAATLRYWFDGIIDHDYDQDIYLSTTNSYYISYNSKQFYDRFDARAFDGYEIVNQNNKGSGDTQYCFYQNSGNRGEYLTGNASTVQEDRTIYQYYRSSEWAGTTFYNTVTPVYSSLDPLHWFDPIRYDLSDPISISFHGNRNNEDSELEAGWTDKKDDYQITVGGSQKTDGNVYYVDTNEVVQTMSWNVFVNEVIASRSKTAQHTVIESGKTINYYYRALSYTLTLMSYDGTTVLGTKTVTYKAPVTGENGALADVTRPTADAGKQFKCWSLAQNDKEPFSGTMPAHNLVLYAQDEPVPVTVTFQDCYYDMTSGKFVYENGTSETSYRVTNDYNTDLRDFVPEKPAMANATFEGWTDASGNPISQNTKVTRNMTVYPSFSGFRQYKVIYDLNEGVGTPPSDTNQYVEGAEIVVKQGTGLTKAFTDINGASHNGPFTHWNTQADGNGRSYFPGDVIVFGQDTATDDQGVQTLTLYAQYNKYRETTLTYDKNTTDAGSELRAVNAGESITTEADGTVVVQFLDDTQTQTAGGGIPNTKITIGQDKNGIEFEAYRPGYVFIGWARTADAAVPEAENGDHAYINTLTKGGNTLYAVWAICKVVDSSGEHAFTTLNRAYDYINNNMSGTGTIEMLVDYTMPSTDTLTVASGKNITLTTAPTAAADTASQWKYHYVGANKDNANAPYAVITRGYDGGSMFTSAGTFTTTNITLDGGSTAASAVACSSNGGIVNVTGTLNIQTGTTMQNSTAANGGAVYASGGYLNIGEVRILDCYATQNGGAIYLSGSVQAGESGMIIDGHSGLSLNKTDDENRADAANATANAQNGGGIYVAPGASFTFTGGELTKCKASGNGGAIYNAGTVKMTENPETSSTHVLTNGSIEYCSATNGGAIYNAAGGTVDMGGGYIEHCMASGNGGGIYTASTAKQTIAGTEVGAVDLHTDSTHPGKINLCSADGNGGGIYLAAGELDMTGGEIVECSAANGGGLYMANGTTVKLDELETVNTLLRGSIESCTASTDGGGIYVGTGATLTMNGGAIEHCVATGNGGGIFNDGTFEMTNTSTKPGVINDCHATNGGGIYLGRIATNNAIVSISISGGTIQNCYATGNGGAIYDNSKASITLNGVTINGHTDDGFTAYTKNAQQGGGIYLPQLDQDYNSSLTITNCNLYNLTAAQGGTIFSNRRSLDASGAVTGAPEDIGCNITITGGEINGHTGEFARSAEPNAGNGGMLYLGNGAVSIINTNIYNCTVAGSGAESGDPSKNMTAGSGGVIFNVGNGHPKNDKVSPTVTLSGVTIDGHQGAFKTANPDLINAKNGGAIFMKMAILSMRDCTLKNLRVDGKGSAIFGYTNGNGDTPSRITIVDGMIENNTATGTDGGAINVVSGAKVKNNTSGTKSSTVSFGGNAVVYNNLNGSGAQANMVLEHDPLANDSDGTNNGVIMTTSAGLTSGAHIGVYVVDTNNVYNGHGRPHDPFGSWGAVFNQSSSNPYPNPTYKNGTGDSCLFRFTNDRNGCWGVKIGDDGLIYWNDPIVKITDKNDNLLYEEIEDGIYLPAVYEKLRDGLNAAEGALYTVSGTTYTAADAMSSSELRKMKMLQDYEIPNDDNVTLSKPADNIVLTTAETTTTGHAYMSTNKDTYIFKPSFTLAEGRIAEIKDPDTNEVTTPADSATTAILLRGFTGDALISINNTSASLITKNIIFDGNSDTFKRSGKGCIIDSEKADTILIQNTIVRNCESSEDGGGIFIGGGGQGGRIANHVTLNEVTLDNCVVTGSGPGHSGGGAYLEGPAFANCVTVQDCHADGDKGGGIYFYGADSRLGVTYTYTNDAGETVAVNKSSTFENCTAGRGGGVQFFASGGKVIGTETNRVTFTNCESKSEYGGGLSVPNSFSEMSYTTFDGCKAKTNGGGLGITRDGGTISNTIFIDCTAQSGGGAAYFGNTVTLDSVSINGHDPTKADADKLSADTENAQNGGGIYQADGTLTIKGTSTIENCYASNGGGGVHVAKKKMTMTQGTPSIKNCKASVGGAIFGTGSTTEIQISVGEISGNEATGWGGGAMRLEGDAKATISGTALFKENKVTGFYNEKYGGAVSIKKGKLTVSGGEISNNSVEPTAKDGYGGAIHISGTGSDSSEVVITGGKITNNKVKSRKAVYGGAISLKGANAKASITGSTVEISGNSLESNTESDKDSWGGAISIREGSELTLTNGKIYANTASAETNGRAKGAGIYVDATSFIKLSGNPIFHLDGEADNTVAKTGYGDKTNGWSGSWYPEVTPATTPKTYLIRQDIYTAEPEENPAAIILTGQLTNNNGNNDGSIWIWAESENHFKQLMPFATVDLYTEGDNVGEPKFTPSEATMKVFRNAQDDGDTENGTETYLFGTTGDESKYIYWTGVGGYRKVILRKVDSSYAAVSGKTFTIYKGSGSKAYTPKGETAALENLDSKSSGVFYIGTLPYGWYIVKENVSPAKYFYIVVVESGTYGTLFTDTDNKVKDKIDGYDTLKKAQDAASAKYNELK